MNLLTENNHKNHCYNCNICSFISNNKKDYTRHLITAKHNILTELTNTENMLTNTESMLTNTESVLTNTHLHICKICNKKYKSRVGLWKHNKICIPIDNINITTLDDPLDSNNEHLEKSVKHLVDMVENQKLENVFTPAIYEPTSTQIELLTTIIMNMASEHKDFKDIITEQNKLIIDLASKQCNIINNNNNTQNNTQNNNFNIKMFLNEICKDAMTMNEFASGIIIQLDEVENFGHNGYIEGITSIIKSRLDKLDITQRPIHCTDVKRETLHIKEKDEWVSNETNRNRLRQVVQYIAKKNLKKIPEWEENNPNGNNLEHKLYDFRVKLQLNALGALGEEQIKLDDTIMKNIAHLVYVDKQKYKQVT